MYSRGNGGSCDRGRGANYLGLLFARGFSSDIIADMTTRSGWQRAGSGGLLLIILLCLCFSRGEGVRLLPFSETAAFHATGTASLTSGTASNPHDKVQSTLERKVSSHPTKSLAKHLAALGGATFADPTLGPQIWRDPRTKSGVWHGPSKFLLTSSSDRSPPSPVSARNA